MKRAIVAACAAALAVSAAGLTAGTAAGSTGSTGSTAAAVSGVTKIVFADGDLWLIGADGTGLHALTATGDTSSPTFAPGGVRIAYVHGGEVWQVTDGGTAHQLTHVGGSARDAAWSPDGRWIAFTAAAGSFRDVFRIHPWGGAVVRTTFVADRGCYAETPAWAPDSARVAYVREPSGSGTCSTGGIVVQPIGGSGFVAVPAFARGPSFTADGKHLVYLATCNVPDICGSQTVGWESDASGGHRHMVATEHLCSEGDLCLARMLGSPGNGWVEALTFSESDDPDAIHETCYQGAHEDASGAVVLNAPHFCKAAIFGQDFDVH